MSTEIRVTEAVIERVIKVGQLHNEIETVCRNSLITDNASRLVELVKNLTHIAIMLEEEITGKPVATIAARTEPYHTYDLDSVMDFGKYKGHTVQDVIQVDPVYVMWAHDHVKRFKLPANVVDALITIL